MTPHRRPPFVPTSDPSTIVVPGVDSNAPPAIQLEQIEQSITLKLAAIDDNLARSHQIITSKILPAVQRFARASQPTRDAAKFWISFFEAAAQVHVPTGGDYSTSEAEEGTESMDEEGHTITTESESPSIRRGQDHQPRSAASNTTYDTESSRSEANLNGGQSTIPTEHSFAGVVASTPARMRGEKQAQVDLTQDSSTTSDASWSPSHATMLNVLNHQLRGAFRLDDRKPQVPQASRKAGVPQGPLSNALEDISSVDSMSSIFQPPTPSASGSEQSLNLLSDFPAHHSPNKGKDKGKGKAPSGNLRQNVLKRGAEGTPKLARYNPFLPANDTSKSEQAIDPLKWNGIVDLTASPSLSNASSASVAFSDFMHFTSDESGGRSQQHTNNKSTDPFRPVSPSPILLRFPPADQKVTGTPSKKAADLLVADLLAGMDLEDTPNASAPTPPSLARYRTLGEAGPSQQNPPRPKGMGASIFGGPTRPTRPPAQPAVQQPPATHFASAFPLLKDDDYGQEESIDDSFADDSLVSAGGYGGGSYSAHQANEPDSFQQGEEIGDEGDSFDSEDSYMGGSGSGGGGGINFGGGIGGQAPDDEDTLFGPRGNAPPRPDQEFRLDGRGMRTWMGGRLEDAVPMQGSPTPFAGDFVPLDKREQHRK